jgi:periplasmic divalent cation tolerance protein
MAMADGHIVIMSTTSSEAEASRIANVLVTAKAAACVQIMPIRSCYVWDGKVNNDAEFLLLIKTRAALFDRAAELIRQNHSYDVPEIISVPVGAGSPAYLRWIDDVTST